MPQQRLYYDYVDGKLIPFWYVLTFDYREIKWDKRVQYYEAYKPFEYIERHEFDDSIITTSISLADFIFNKYKPNQIGLNIAAIKEKIFRYGVDPFVVRQFLLPSHEIDGLISMLPVERQMSLVVNN